MDGCFTVKRVCTFRKPKLPQKLVIGMGGITPMHSEEILLKVPTRLSFQSLSSLIGIKYSAKLSQFAIGRFVSILFKYFQLDLIIDAVRNFGM